MHTYIQVCLEGGEEPLLVLFIISTVENEQPPEKAGRCIRFFHRDEHPKDMLAQLHYAVSQSVSQSVSQFIVMSIQRICSPSVTTL